MEISQLGKSEHLVDVCDVKELFTVLNSFGAMMVSWVCFLKGIHVSSKYWNMHGWNDMISWIFFRIIQNWGSRCGYRWNKIAHVLNIIKSCSDG